MKYSKSEKQLFNEAGIYVEDKDYTNEELRRYESQIEDFIMSHSTKNGDISKLSNQYNSILNTLVKGN